MPSLRPRAHLPLLPRPQFLPFLPPTSTSGRRRSLHTQTERARPQQRSSVSMEIRETREPREPRVLKGRRELLAQRASASALSRSCTISPTPPVFLQLLLLSSLRPLQATMRGQRSALHGQAHTSTTTHVHRSCTPTVHTSGQHPLPQTD